MKVLETQSAVLTNCEVYQHLVEQRQSYRRNKRRGPPNLETVVRELLQHLRTYPNPLSQEANAVKPGCIAALVTRLRPYDLSKGEVAMVLNLRPTSIVTLNTVVEDMDERFTETQQREMVTIIVETLGQFEAEPRKNGELTADVDDAPMTDAA